MNKDRSWKKADYPNARPGWQKDRAIKEATKRAEALPSHKKEVQLKRVLASLDWEKLAIIGKERRK